MRRIAATMLGSLLWLPSSAAQVRAPELGERFIPPEPVRALLVCPFPGARLSAKNPAELAWATTCVTAQDLHEPQVRADFLAALRLVKGGATKEHRLALLHVLHAAVRTGMVVPAEELRFQPVERARIPWIELRVRAVTNSGGDLFELFQSLDARQDPAWEVVGGALAISKHPAFAIELRTRMTPHLRISAGTRPTERDEPTPSLPPPDDLPYFPNSPTYRWKRVSGVVVAACDGTKNQRDCEVTLEGLDAAPLRWLAELGDEIDPRAWSARFHAHYSRTRLDQFVAFAETSEKRTRDSLARVDAAIRSRFRVPPYVKFPDLVVTWEDFREEHRKAQETMPVQPFFGSDTSK